MVSPASDSYAALSPAARIVAQAYGVAAPRRLGVTRCQRLLAKADFTLLSRRVTTKQIAAANQELVDAGLALRSSAGEVGAAAWSAVPLTQIAHQDGNMERLMAACQQVFSTSWFDDAEDMMQLRCYVVAGDHARLGPLVEETYHGFVDWGFLAEPLAEDLLRTLPVRYLEDALRSCLHHVIETAGAPAPVIDVCQRLSASPAVHAPTIAFIRILQGRFEEAEAVFAALPPSERGTKLVATELAATRAAIAFLRGNDTLAWQHINETLALEKAGTRKRLIFVNSRAFTLSLLALVRIDSPQSHELLEQILNAAERSAAEHIVDTLDLVANAVRVQRKQGVFGRSQNGATLNVLFDSLLSCWVEDFHPEPQRRSDLLLAYRWRAVTNGFGWLAAECDEALKRYAELHGAVDAKSMVGEAPTHAALGTATLTKLALPVADWEFPLKAMEQIAHSVSKKASGQRKKQEGAKRLAWELDLSYGQIALSAKEQRQNKNGSWSKGRKIALGRLVAGAAKMDHLLPQDRDAIAAFSLQYWRGRQDYYAGSRSLHQLAGHPQVVDAQGRSVEVVRREPELTVEEDGDDVLVRVEPRSDDFEDEYLIAMPTPQRCEVTQFQPVHQRLLEVVPKEGLTLPADAKSRLLEAVSSLAGDIRVQSDGADGASNAVSVDADAQPWVQLEPLGDGLTVALVVEPIADSGVCFEPGVGGATVFANREGGNVQTRRDLIAERRAVDRLVETCPQLASRPTELHPLVLPSPGECLTLLEQLARAEVRCKWPKGEPFRIVAQASTRSLSLRIKSAEEWMQASGRLAIDEQRVLDLKKLFSLLDASPGERFLPLGNGEFVALTSAFRRQLDDLASLSTPAAKGDVRLNPLAALALDELIEDAEVDADEGWQALRARLQAAQTFEPVLPSTLQAELRPYQLEGYRWLARLSRWGAGACLADDMGLGKTVQTLAVLLDRAPAGAALVVAPTSVVANWVDEARRFAPTLNIKVYVGPPAARESLLATAGAFDIFITTYGLLQNDIEKLTAVSWHTAVLDEAQAIKNPAAKRSRAARRLRADFRVVTTGTPVQNNLMDLHSLFAFLNPGLLGSLQQFRNGFLVPIERDADTEAQARLRRVIAPFMLRRLKTDVLDDLPERTEITLHVEMSADEASLYEALRRRAVEELQVAQLAGAELGEGARRVQVLAHLTRLRLACCNPKLVLDGERESGLPLAKESSKLATFGTTLQELLENRHKVLVFSQFVKHLRLVEAYLQGQGIDYQYLDGSTPAKARTERINAFQAGQGDVFLISLRAGGVGLNLTAADYVIHMDPWWNPAVEDQASDRAHRIGQTRPVTIYRLVTQGTIEEQIVDLHHRKRDLADQLLDGTDASGRLSADELLELLKSPLAA